MRGTVIGERTTIEKAIIGENADIGADVEIGVGAEAPNEFKPDVYSWGIATIGESAVIPDHVKIGKNTVIDGKLSAEDFRNGILPGGGALIKEGGDQV
jgi:glucose-1-phosphate adenylyltransferase